MKYQEGMVIQGKSGKLYSIKVAGGNRQACLKCVFSYTNNDVCYCASHKCMREFGALCDRLLDKNKYFSLFKEGL